jgi:hypothetical protein
MKNKFKTAFCTKAAAFASLLFAGSLQAQTAAQLFIDLDAANQKIIFTTVDVVNSSGDTVTTTQGTVSTVATDANGVITSKSQSFVQVSDGAGGIEQILTQVLIIATPDSFGFFSVDKTTKVRTTPVDASGTATGATIVVTTEDDSEDVASGNLGLAATTTFTPVNEELEGAVLISNP